MHSSRKRTARLLPVSQYALLGGGVPAGGCTCPGGVPARGVYLPGGACPGGCTCPGGVYLPGGCTCPDGVYLAGVSLPRGCTCPGGCTCSEGVYLPGGWLPRYSPLWTEFLTHATENITLPQTSFSGGKNFDCLPSLSENQNDDIFFKNTSRNLIVSPEEARGIYYAETCLSVTKSKSAALLMWNFESKEVIFRNLWTFKGLRQPKFYIFGSIFWSCCRQLRSKKINFFHCKFYYKNNISSPTFQSYHWTLFQWNKVHSQ